MDIKRKLTSRKFWLALIGFIVPVLTAYNMPQEQITQVTSIIMAGATLIAYILAEGFTDASNTDSTIQLIPSFEDISSIEYDEFEDEEDDEKPIEEPELTEEPEVDLSKETGITPEQKLEA